MNRLQSGLRWLWARLQEPSSLSGIAGIVAGAAAVPRPFCWPVIGLGIAAFFMKEAGGAG